MKPSPPRAMDLAALLLIAALILTPLTMAPSADLKKIAHPVGETTHDPSYDNKWKRIISGTRSTDWLTLLVLIFQLFVFGQQAAIAKRQTDLVEQQHVSTHRPRLRIRNVIVHKRRFGRPDPTAMLFADDDIIGQCYVSNIGGTDACIVESFVMAFKEQNGLPMERPYEGISPNDPIIGTIVAGASRPMPFKLVNPLIYGERDRARGGDHPFFIMGWLAYTDVAKTIRRTAFCRQWDASNRRFVRLPDDPDYEHEE